MVDNIHVTVKLATVLARHTGNQKIMDCRLNDDHDLLGVLKDLDVRFPGIKAIICTASHDIVDSINIYVNGDNVRYFQGIRTSLKEGDTVNIIPAAAAG